MTDESTMFLVYSPYRDGIDGLDLIFANKTLREVRRALEHGRTFQTDVAERQIVEALAECDRIRRLLDTRKEAA